MLVTKEDQWTRYFFFFEDGLYKMYLAFNKEALQGKSFDDFGKSMEARYGNAKPVYRDEHTKGGVHHILDHFTWNAGGDKLKLVDRSEFYGVYCLVLDDSLLTSISACKSAARSSTRATSKRMRWSRRSRRAAKTATTRTTTSSTWSPGTEVKKPGTEQHADIQVPSPTPSAGFTPDEDKKKARPSLPRPLRPRRPRTAKKKCGKKSDALDGLEL